jgi:hypothetical protein
VAAPLIIILSLSACDNNFLNKKPEDTISLNNFYKTDQQVEASTNLLYGPVWFQFNRKLMWDVGEVLSGDGRMYGGVPMRPFWNFTVTGDNTDLSLGWASLWAVVAQANALINNLKKDAGPNVDKTTLNQALGEAHVIRAVAYFYLMRIWGSVPIITKNLNHVFNPQVPRNKVSDIYKFITMDLKFGIEHCKHEIRGNNFAANAHISSSTAEALLAKVDLRLKKYADAKKLSEEVIESGEFHLLKNYANLFKTSYNNNPESILQLQWVGNIYGSGNMRTFFYSYSSDVNGVAGYASIGPTINLQNAYASNDKRRKPTIMLAGDHYSDIHSAKGGLTVPKDMNVQGSRAAVKKYVTGTPADNGGQGDADGFPNNTYIMRYADVLLIHAEAILAPNGNFNKSTSNPSALKSFNRVRERAGLHPKKSITMMDILHARRLEFAFEDQYWYTLQRIPRDKAIQIISNQQRGDWVQNDNGQWQIDNKKFTPTNADFTLPYPSKAVDQDKFLTEPPQSYNFNKNSQ